MTDQSTVYFGADRADVQQAIAEMVAIQIRKTAAVIDHIREWCDSTESATRSFMERHSPECECEIGSTRLRDIEEIRRLLPVSGSQREGVTPMASGTRVTRGEDDRDLSVGGSDTGN